MTSNDIFQYSALLLEILGITLAFIEIKFPRTADQLEYNIDSLEDWVIATGQRITNNHLTGVLMTAFVFIFFVILFDVWDFLGLNLPLIIKIIFGVVLLIVGIVIGLYFLEGILVSLNKFSGGHALGSLGVALASLGLAIELFQFVEGVLTP
jgi:hypothetical protein